MCFPQIFTRSQLLWFPFWHIVYHFPILLQQPHHIEAGTSPDRVTSSIIDKIKTQDLWGSKLHDATFSAQVESFLWLFNREYHEYWSLKPLIIDALSLKPYVHDNGQYFMKINWHDKLNQKIFYEDADESKYLRLLAMNLKKSPSWTCVVICMLLTVCSHQGSMISCTKFDFMHKLEKVNTWTQKLILSDPHQCICTKVNHFSEINLQNHGISWLMYLMTFHHLLVWTYLQPRKLQCCIWRDSVKPSLRFSWFCVFFVFKGTPFWLLLHFIWNDFFQHLLFII